MSLKNDLIKLRDQLATDYNHCTGLHTIAADDLVQTLGEVAADMLPKFAALDEAAQEFALNEACPEGTTISCSPVRLVE